VQAKFELRIKMYYDYTLRGRDTVTQITQPCDAGGLCGGLFTYRVVVCWIAGRLCSL